MTLKQKTINSKWERPFICNVGTCVILTPPRIASDLPKPYQYEVTLDNAQEIIKSVRDLIRESETQLQSSLLEIKQIKYGVKLSVFLLGYCLGFCGDLNKGINKENWGRLTKVILLGVVP
mgnify:CR=1 FL=1